MEAEKLKWLSRASEVGGNTTKTKNCVDNDGQENSYDYYLNDLGYRAPKGERIWSRPWEDSIVLVGCSQTFGKALDYEYTTAHYLAQSTGKQVINLGINGSSVDRMFKTFVDLRKRTNPYAVVAIWTDPERYYEWHTRTNGFLAFDVARRDDELYKYMFDHPDYNKEYTSYLLDASRLMWVNKTNFIEVTWSIAIKNVHRIEYLDNALDGRHWGPKTHKSVADYITDQLANSL